MYARTSPSLTFVTKAPRFYCPGCTIKPGQRVVLPAALVRHAKALRLKQGSAITLFNGLGGEYAAYLLPTGRGTAQADIIDWHPVEREAPLAIRLIQALISSDKMDISMQKAVELGVASLQPVESQRSSLHLSGERSNSKMVHWQRVVIAAAEQCGRNRLPSVETPLPITEFLSMPSNSALRLLLDPAASHPLGSIKPRINTLPRHPAYVDVLIGPEGGFTAEENEAARQAGFQACSLGPRLMRAETAAIAAMTLLQAQAGGLG